MIRVINLLPNIAQPISNKRAPQRKNEMRPLVTDCVLNSDGDRETTGTCPIDRLLLH